MIPVRVPLPGPDIQVSLFKERVKGLYASPSLEVEFRGIVYLGEYIFCYLGGVYILPPRETRQKRPKAFCIVEMASGCTQTYTQKENG